MTTRSRALVVDEDSARANATADVLPTEDRERKRLATTKQEFIASLEDRLTDRQLTALRRAYFGEFFDRL